MFRSIALILVLSGMAAVVAAQEPMRPLSPPDRSPVPLTAADQERALSAGPPKPEKAAATTVTHSRHITSGNAVADSLAYEAASRYSLDPCLIISVMQAESGFRIQAVSPKGACGLMQLIPATAVRFGVRNIFDPRENVMGGANYLRWLLNRFGGDVRLALAGYNAGEGAVEFYGNRIPPFLETQNYVRSIYGRYSRIHNAPAVTEAVPAAALEAATPSEEKNPTYNQIIRFTSSTSEPSSASVR